MNRAKTNCLTNCFSWAAVARCCTFRENSIVQSWSTNYDVCSWEMITLVSTPSEHQLVCGLLQRNIVWLCPSYRRSLLPPLFCLTYFDFWLPLWFLQTFLLYFDDELLFAQTHCCNEQRNITGKQYFTFNTKEGNKHVVASI